MKTLKRTLLLCLALLVLVPAQVMAEEKQEVAVIDVKKILSDSKATKSIQEQIEKQRKKIQTDVSKQEEELRKEDQKLAEQRSVLSAEAFKEKQSKFKEKVLKAQKEVQEHRGKLENAYNNALAKVQEELIAILGDMAKKRGFKVVIPAAHIAYFEKSLDITEEVMNKLDDKLSTVKVEIK